MGENLGNLGELPTKIGSFSMRIEGKVEGLLDRVGTVLGLGSKSGFVRQAWREEVFYLSFLIIL